MCGAVNHRKYQPILSAEKRFVSAAAGYSLSYRKGNEEIIL
jgi:hypothetical protein